MGRQVAIFLFAHQDDEFAIFAKIKDEVRAGREVFCAYFTDGGELALRRNEESLRVLTRLGVPEAHVLFPGLNCAIPDGFLPEHMPAAMQWLFAWLSQFENLHAVYVPAWEGGHQDHDALHVVAASVLDKLGIIGRASQFSLYHGYRCPGPFYKVLMPLETNGKMKICKISWRDRVQFLGFCLSYPSQKKTWLGLFPFVLFAYCFDGTQKLQAVLSPRYLGRPHDGALYYEKRRFYTWEKFDIQLKDYLVKHFS